MQTLDKVRVQDVDSPAVGSLNAWRERKAASWKRVKSLRQRVRDLAPCAGNLRLELLKAEGFHRECIAGERDSLRAIERRANELGQTIGSVD